MPRRIFDARRAQYMPHSACLLVLVAVGIVNGAAPDLKNKFVYHPGFIGAGNDVQTARMMTPQAALQACDHLPRCRAITYHGTNDTTTVQKVYFKDVSASMFDESCLMQLLDARSCQMHHCRSCQMHHFLSI